MSDCADDRGKGGRRGAAYRWFEHRILLISGVGIIAGSDQAALAGHHLE
jgi:hypothetical protein